ncbi:MAG: selenide, water dikinase SelD [Deltaproteobacteria bacterium RBG_13_53_10]|nr:MAG: selenide, water dikinase SelD [Deltaproteobacteria bacterium RBG_13_53_10]
MLRELLLPKNPRVLVGPETSDDAGVYQLDEETALVQTVDFFTPIVDDPFTFGQIAVVNALSDVYAMGGTPLTGMNLVAFPIKSLSSSILKEILRGGLSKMNEAGVALVGGHTVDDPEIKYGLAVTGIVNPKKIITNAGAKPGDRLILTKPLGTGVIESKRIPIFSEALDYARSGFVPGGAYSNRDFFSCRVDVHPDVSPTLIDLLYDPQTSGGLLISLPAEKASTLAERLQGEKIDARIIGEVTQGPPGKIRIL